MSYKDYENMSEYELYYKRKNAQAQIKTWWTIIKFLIKCLPFVIGTMLLIGGLLFVGVHIQFFSGAFGGYLGLELSKRIDRNKDFSQSKRILLYLFLIGSLSYFLSLLGLFSKSQIFPNVEVALNDYLVFCREIFVSIQTFIIEF